MAGNDRCPPPSFSHSCSTMDTLNFDQLKNKCIELSESFPIMPIDEIRLAGAFTELAEQERVVKRLIAELFDHPGLHVRRIAVNACRRSGAFGVPGLQAALTRKLEDSAAWVGYNAAWAIHSVGVDSPRIRRL
ncbi:MAG: hypothetical protein ABI589_14105, partial [Burkholderiales bacterium]